MSETEWEMKAPNDSLVFGICDVRTMRPHNSRDRDQSRLQTKYNARAIIPHDPLSNRAELYTWLGLGPTSTIHTQTSKPPRTTFCLAQPSGHEVPEKTTKYSG